jgi:hypothetical protein
VIISKELYRYTYLIILLKVISKVLFFNITQKFTNLLVQLSIFLIDLFVGTYRLSSHARLEAFVIQTKLIGIQPHIEYVGLSQLFTYIHYICIYDRMIDDFLPTMLCTHCI